MRSFFGEDQQRGIVNVRIFLFDISKKAHGQACTDYFLIITRHKRQLRMKKN